MSGSEARSISRVCFYKRSVGCSLFNTACKMRDFLRQTGVQAEIQQKRTGVRNVIGERPRNVNGS